MLSTASHAAEILRFTAKCQPGNVSCFSKKEGNAARLNNTRALPKAILYFSPPGIIAEIAHSLVLQQLQVIQFVKKILKPAGTRGLPQRRLYLNHVENQNVFVSSNDYLKSLPSVVLTDEWPSDGGDFAVRINFDLILLFLVFYGHGPECRSPAIRFESDGGALRGCTITYAVWPGSRLDSEPPARSDEP